MRFQGRVLHVLTCRELTQQNELLRSKEAKHLEALETVEAVLHTLGAVVEQPASGTKQHAKWLEAVLLDMQALTLKQALQLNTAAAAPQDSLAPSSVAPTPGAVAPSIQAASEATCSRSTSSSMHTTGSESSSGMSLGASTSSSGGGDNPHSNSRHRVTRLLASLTPEEIMQCKGCTMAELAGGKGWGRACVGCGLDPGNCVSRGLYSGALGVKTLMPAQQPEKCSPSKDTGQAPLLQLRAGAQL